MVAAVQDIRPRFDPKRGWIADDLAALDEEPVPSGFVVPELERGILEPFSKRTLEKERVVNLFYTYQRLSEEAEDAADRLRKAELYHLPDMVEARKDWQAANKKACWGFESWLHALNDFGGYEFEERVEIQMKEGWWTPLKYSRTASDGGFCFHRDRMTPAVFKTLPEAVIWLHRVVMLKNGQIAD